nr:uncharacterized protein LOC109995858 isoform X1 [Labrus bergylta]
MKMAAAFIVSALLICSSFTSCTETPDADCEQFAPAGGNFTVLLPVKLDATDRLMWKRNGENIFRRHGELMILGKVEDVSEDGSLRLRQVTKEMEGTYEAEVYTQDGKSRGMFQNVLCVQDADCEQFAPAGGDFTLHLPVKLDATDRLMWKRNGENILRSHGELMILGKVEDVSEDGSLRLRQVTKKMEGTYEAEVYTRDGISRGTFQNVLCVQDADCEQFAPAGGDFTVHLPAKLDATDRLMWKRNGENIFRRHGELMILGKVEDVSEDGSLRLRQVTKKMEGTYEAEVYTRDGISRGTFQNVLCVQDADCEQFAPAGGDFTLHLPAKLDATDRLMWKRNGENIFRRHRQLIILGKVEDVSEDGSLRLRQVTKEMEGTYEAEVYTQDGKSRGTFQNVLCVQDADCEQFAPAGGDFTVLLPVKLDATDRLMWKRNGENIFRRHGELMILGKVEDVSEDGSLRLRQVTKKMEGTYEAEVYTRDGISRGTFQNVLCVQGNYTNASP